MESVLKALLSEAGVQWMGWAIAVGQFIWLQKKDAATTKLLVGISEKSTKAIVEFTVLLSERVPRGRSE